METIGLVGFGKMGAPIAQRLRAAGHRLRVFDRSAERRAASSSRGLTTATSVADACSGADSTILCLPDAQAVEAAVCGDGGLLQSALPPQVCVDLTSSSPATTVRLAEILKLRGITFLDAPVSGGVDGASSGTLTVMVGGTPPDRERIQPLLECFASTITWAGPLGSGHAAKAINNALSALSLTVTAEVIAIGSLAGLDATKIVDVINQGFGRSQNSEVKYPRYILSGTYASQFLLSQMLKDISVACGMGAASDIPVPMTAVLGQIWRAALANLGPAADSTQIAQYLVTPASGNGHLDGANPDHPLDTTTEQLNLALFASCFIGALELLTLGERYHLDRDRLLAIINASSGRSEATRSLVARHDGSRGSSTVTIQHVMDALGWGQALAARARLFVPMTALASELLRQAGQKLGWESDLQMLASTPVVA